MLVYWNSGRLQSEFPPPHPPAPVLYLQSRLFPEKTLLTAIVNRNIIERTPGQLFSLAQTF